MKPSRLVTQWQIVGATARLSEVWLEPMLAALLRQFPFPIRSFHSDNGSEFINQTMALLLNKLLIQQTKGRPRHSNDNGLVETKNGAMIRKHMGYAYIDAEHAQPIQHFYSAHLNPYLNYHRPCAQAAEIAVRVAIPSGHYTTAVISAQGGILLFFRRGR